MLRQTFPSWYRLGLKRTVWLPVVCRFIIGVSFHSKKPFSLSETIIDLIHIGFVFFEWFDVAQNEFICGVQNRNQTGKVALFFCQSNALGIAVNKLFHVFD
ncbi:hypothetical protein BpHYR1_026983 [Brachionus plicatilis]|uniref:Uncharacterized protein n=1 Tax=Brachionus plicatilis TaxID=10195 RepID=A0A3M7SPM0_BRAPC|nr:hypothetical protein BpHYR1_026983 [Brachionus plicatilis]